MQLNDTPLDDSADEQVMQADVVVIGGGLSGLPAAVSAAEAGARKVLVLERRKLLGGTGRMVGNLFGVDSPEQRRQGIEHAADEIFDYHMERAHWRCDARLARNLIDASKDVLAWLESKGAKFQRVVASTGKYRCSHQIIDGSGESLMPLTGNVIAQILIDECKRLGVEISLETRATQLLTDGAGTVTGVRAVQKGKAVRIDAKSVIVATGSITGNKALMKTYFPEVDFNNVRIAADLPWASGDGMIMAQDIGAARDALLTRLYVGPDYATGNRLMILVHRPHVILVNRHGLRFVDEALVCTNDDHSMVGSAIERQPGNQCWALIDRPTLELMVQRREVLNTFEEIFGQMASPDVFGTLEAGAESGPEALRGRHVTAWLDGLVDELESEAKNGRVLISDSLDEIAAWIGADAATLKSQVERYNGYCERGRDGEFNKPKEWLLPLTRPPYYAVRGGQLMDSVFGGIRINHEMAVLNGEFNAIAGLYAVGIATSGWLGPSGLGGLDGLCSMLSQYSGLVAGRNAAARAQATQRPAHAAQGSYFWPMAADDAAR
ncbi:MAG: FAD-dependent oxidoreductase [Proteobacteria bacterium]|nr:FAD-dependent oxidoreductase [Pseudomonadota bacterium]